MGSHSLANPLEDNINKYQDKMKFLVPLLAILVTSDAFFFRSSDTNDDQKPNRRSLNIEEMARTLGNILRKKLQDNNIQFNAAPRARHSPVQSVLSYRRKAVKTYNTEPVPSVLTYNDEPEPEPVQTYVDAEPIITYNAEPIQTYNAKPVQTYEAEPVKPYEAEPVITYEAEPVITYEAEPEITYEAEPVITYDTEPVITYEDEPVITYDTEPVITYEIEPVITYEAEPVITYEAEPV